MYVKWSKTETAQESPSPAGRSPQRTGTHAKYGRILRGARGRVGGERYGDTLKVLHQRVTLEAIRGCTERRHSMKLSVDVYSHPPKASYCVASPRRTKAYCLRRRALSETFGGWLYNARLLAQNCRRAPRPGQVPPRRINIKPVEKPANNRAIAGRPASRARSACRYLRAIMCITATIPAR